jgi:hypothetical protein
MAHRLAAGVHPAASAASAGEGWCGKAATTGVEQQHLAGQRSLGQLGLGEADAGAGDGEGVQIRADEGALDLRGR